jgi:hypothetical protein
MVSREAFGPNLRRLRHRRDVSLESIAAATNVPVAVWQALEDDDLYGWPSGVFARALVADYARLIGTDPDAVVDDFCRLFPKGDRRRSRVLADYAALIGQSQVSTDDRPPGQERRAGLQSLQLRNPSRRERLAGAVVEYLVRSETR